MTYREAANRIEEHIQIHYKNEYPHAVLITEALQMAMTLLRERADLETAPRLLEKATQYGMWTLNLERLRKEKCCKFMASLGHIVKDTW